MRKTIVAIAVLVFFVAGIVPIFAADGCCPSSAKAAKPAAKVACPTDGKCCPTKDKANDKCPFMGNSKTPGAGACAMAKSVKKPAVKTVSAVCPVMGSKIANVKKAAGGKSVYKGKTYYFCCAGCKPMFDKNPEKYLTKKK